MMTRALPVLVLVAVVGCGPSQTEIGGVLPVCTGSATFDIGGGCSPEGSEWYHGEHTCPDEVICGEVADCMAFSEWPYGTCICPEPSYYGDLAFVEPAGATLITSEDDVDPDTPGLQLEIVLDAGCWMDYDFEWLLALGSCGDVHGEPDFLIEPDESGRASRIIDFNGLSGIMTICAWITRDGEFYGNLIDVTLHIIIP